MTENTRSIPLVPTWRVAVQILTTALENGTGTGKEAARAELLRMADILDQLRDQQDEPTTTFDVIADALKQPAAAFGQSFASEDDAKAYAEQLEATGYSAEVLPGQDTVKPAEALRIAAEYFGDDRLNPEQEATE